MTSDHLDTLDLDGLRREAERLGYVRRDERWRHATGIACARSVIRFDGRVPWVCGDGTTVADEPAALRWLLRTDEARARRECYERGRAEEAEVWLRLPGARMDPGRVLAVCRAEYERGAAEARAAVVAWLRAEADAADPESSAWSPYRAADAIERGEAP